MKRFAAVILTMAVLVVWFAAVPAVSEGDQTVRIAGEDLGIQSYGFTNDAHTSYSVTVSGYNVLLTGKFGNIGDLMPFRVGIAWDLEHLDQAIIADSFALQMDPVTIALFDSPDGSPMEEPAYILISKKGGNIREGKCYVIAEGRFHDTAELMPTPTPAPSPTPAPTQAPVDLAVKTPGQTLNFGRYPQMEEGTDETPIEWIVLEYDEVNHRVLLLSKYGLDTKQYNDENMGVTWETCSLRVWLNNDFLNRAFNAEEQSAILLTDVDNSDEQGYSGWDTPGGNNTQDRIFLLSYAEAKRYFDVEDEDVRGSRTNKASRAAPTAYATGQGAYIDTFDKTADGSLAGWWWLRSPGLRQNYAARVIYHGATNFGIVDNHRGSVRPALWIDLESDWFLSAR